MFETKEKKEDECCQHKHDEDKKDYDDVDDDQKIIGSNRGEKKFRKAMLKMGMKPVQGINRITIIKSKNFQLHFDDPDVMKSPDSQSYVVYGKPNLNNQTGANIGQTLKHSEPTKQTSKIEIKKNQGQDQELSEQGLKPENIEEVMNYGKCTRQQAIKVLRECGDDTVNAILKLSEP